MTQVKRMDWKITLPAVIFIIAVSGSILAKPEGEITVYGRRSTSGTYIYFRNHVLENEYSQEMYNMTGNQAIVDAVKNDKTGIGYVGVGFVTTKTGETVDGIKILDIARNKNSEPVSPLKAINVKTGKYPIARALYQYTSAIPGRESPVYKFLKFELNEKNEEILKDTGFYPITEEDWKQNGNQFQKIENEKSSKNTLRIKGSDTELQLVSSFAQAYAEQHPETNITVEGGGSGTGIAALIGGRTDIANSSRKMKPEEIEQAKNRGIDPLEFIIARDTISIIVNEDNPAENLTLQEVSKIFTGEITSWEKLGVKNGD